MSSTNATFTHAAILLLQVTSTGAMKLPVGVSASDLPLSV